MLKNKKLLVLTSAVTLLPVLAGLLLWNRMPESVPVHWNAAGEVDGYGSRAMVVFGLFGFLFVMHWLCIGATLIDPKSRELGGKAVALVLWILPVMSLVLAVIVYCTALGVAVSVNVVLPVVLGLLFVLIGNWMPKCPRNYTIGIKVPWALDDDENWNATHRFAGKLWVVGGLLLMATALMPKAMVCVLLPLLILMALLPMAYSFAWHKKNPQEKDPQE